MADPPRFGKRANRRPVADPPRFGKRKERRPMADPPRFGKRSSMALFPMAEHIDVPDDDVDTICVKVPKERKVPMAEARIPMADFVGGYGKRAHRRPVADPPRFGKRGERRPMADPPRFGKRDSVSQYLTRT